MILLSMILSKFRTCRAVVALRVGGIRIPSKNVRFFKQMSVFLNSSPLFARVRMLKISPGGSCRRFQQNQTQPKSI